MTYHIYPNIFILMCWICDLQTSASILKAAGIGEASLMIDVIDDNDHRLGHEFMRLILAYCDWKQTAILETEATIFETETTHTQYS